MDLIDACGQTLKAALGLPYAGQEPQNKDSIPSSGLVIIERVGGSMTQFGRSDQPWIQFTVLAAVSFPLFSLWCRRFGGPKLEGELELKAER